jgi:thioesterase domain-containing protein
MNSMTEDQLEKYLYANIPLTKALQVSVVSLKPGEVTLAAPLAPNINHQKGVFGGSAATLATTAAWSLVHTQLIAAGVPGEVVIQRSTMEFVLPMKDEFVARAFVPHPEAWPKFVQMLKRRGRARIAVSAEVSCQGQVSGAFEGEFVALDSDRQ